MKWLGSIVLVLGLSLFGCGGGDDSFTEADWDDFYYMCLTHEALDRFNCERSVDWVEWYVNEKGYDEECVFRALKIAWAEIGARVEARSQVALTGC